MKNLSIYFLLVVVFTACENEIPFNIKNNPPKLIINALLNSDNDENYVSLSLTGRDSITLVKEAQVNLYVNGDLKEQQTETNETLAYVLKSKFKPGDKVKIEVQTNDGKYHAWAEDIVPYPIEIEQVDTMSYIEGEWEWDYYTNKYMRFKTTFTDNSSDKNYYRLAVLREDTIYGTIVYSDIDTMLISKRSTYLYTNEDIVLNGGRIPIDDENSLVNQAENEFCVFDDSYLNGRYTMTVSSYIADHYIPSLLKNKRISTTLKVCLISITEAEYYYLRALNLYYSNNYEEYLSQPISFPGNVHGGIGIVGFEAGNSQAIRLPDSFPEDIPGGY